MNKLLVFAGTTEGRLLAEALQGQNVEVSVCVATEYGETLIEEAPNIHVLVGRKNEDQMAELMEQLQPELTVDATHPYAAEVTRTIRAACQRTGTEYLRVLRSEEHEGTENCVFVSDTEAAVDYLNRTEGAVLLTVGSKELPAYTKVENFAGRLYPRVLPLPKVVEQVSALGFPGKNIIAMQGPFPEALNVAMLGMLGARYLVTKDTGTTGGFPEKLKAARACGVQVIVVRRPLDEEGLSLGQCLQHLRKRFDLPEQKRVTVLGIGTGSFGSLTVDAEQALKSADCIIGARRITDSLSSFRKPSLQAVLPGDIAEKIRTCSGRHVVVAMSGDTGFYSGTKKLLPLLKEFSVQVLPGISSVVYLCSRIGTSWDDALLASTHGRSCNFLAKIRKNPKVILLTGGDLDAAAVIRSLCENGMEDVKITVGQNLSYDNEEIITGTAEELHGRSFEPLAVILAENPRRWICCQGRPDEDFLRAEVPMTKQEVRSVTLSKLMLTRDAVCYDVGAGTGSVTLEMADTAEDGFVYAIERKKEACDLIRQNMRHLAISNVQVVEGLAPEAMEDLPAPTHAFIGGSSGNLRIIIETLLAKNPRVRIVVNTVTAESLAEAVSCIHELPVEDVEIITLSAARGRKVGRSHLMTAQNPVYVISFQGGKAHE